jgi:hypothetical protein
VVRHGGGPFADVIIVCPTCALSTISVVVRRDFLRRTLASESVPIVTRDYAPACVAELDR